MEIKINFPSDRGSIKDYLDQLELCVHHAKKAFKSACEDNELSEDQFVCIEQPVLETSLGEDNIDLDNYYTEQQDIVLVMNVQ